MRPSLLSPLCFCCCVRTPGPFSAGALSNCCSKVFLRLGHLKVKSLALFSGARGQSGSCQRCLLVCKISSGLKMKICCSPELWLNLLSVSLKCFLYIARVQMLWFTFNCVFVFHIPFAHPFHPVTHILQQAKPECFNYI